MDVTQLTQLEEEFLNLLAREVELFSDRYHTCESTMGHLRIDDIDATIAMVERFKNEGVIARFVRDPDDDPLKWRFLPDRSAMTAARELSHFRAGAAVRIGRWIRNNPAVAVLAVIMAILAILIFLEV